MGATLGGPPDIPADATGYVSYFPNLRQFGTSIDRGSAAESETGPEFDSIDDAVAWVSERTRVAYVLFGTSESVVFGIGDAADPGAEQVDGLRPWPPDAGEVERLVAQMDVDYGRAMAKPQGNFPDSAILETDDE